MRVFYVTYDHTTRNIDAYVHRYNRYLSMRRDSVRKYYEKYKITVAGTYYVNEFII